MPSLIFLRTVVLEKLKRTYVQTESRLIYIYRFLELARKPVAGYPLSSFAGYPGLRHSTSIGISAAREIAK